MAERDTIQPQPRGSTSRCAWSAGRRRAAGGGAGDRGGRVSRLRSWRSPPLRPARLLWLGSRRDNRSADRKRAAQRVVPGGPLAPASVGGLAALWAPENVVGSQPGTAAAYEAASRRTGLPGDLMIADRGNNRILVVDPAGHIVFRYPAARRPRAPVLRRRHVHRAGRRMDHLQRGGQPRDRPDQPAEPPLTAPVRPPRRTGLGLDPRQHARRRLHAPRRHVHGRRRLQLPHPVHPRAPHRAQLRSRRESAATTRRATSPPVNGDTPGARRRRAGERDRGQLDRRNRSRRAAALGAQGAGRLSLGPAAAARRARAAGRLLEPGPHPDHRPPRQRAVALRARQRLRAPRPALAGDGAAQRGHRGQRRLPRPRPGHRPAHEQDRVEIRPHRPSRDGATATSTSPTGWTSSRSPPTARPTTPPWCTPDGRPRARLRAAGAASRVARRRALRRRRAAAALGARGAPSP